MKEELLKNNKLLLFDCKKMNFPEVYSERGDWIYLWNILKQFEIQSDYPDADFAIDRPDSYHENRNPLHDYAINRQRGSEKYNR